MSHPPLTIGLTGGIASGKSTVAALFEELGAPVLDADTVAREVVGAGSPVLASITAAFGPGFLLGDGTLDRRKLRERVFADDSARRTLETLTHPAIRERLRAWRDAQTAPYCLLSVAILLESGMDSLVDRVLVVDCSEAAQLSRLMQRDDSSEALARRMLAAQLGRSERLARAHDVIENNAGPEVLHLQVFELHLKYLRLRRKEP